MGQLPQGLAISGDGFLKFRGSALTPGEYQERTAQIGLRGGPIKRCALAIQLPQRPAIGGHGFFEVRGSVLAAPQNSERIAEIVLNRCPLKGNTLSRTKVHYALV